MADESVGRNFIENPDPQSKQVSGDDISHAQDQQTFPERLLQSLFEWLERINRRPLSLGWVHDQSPGQ